MGAFEYVALDQAGKESKGLLEGDTPKHVLYTVGLLNTLILRIMSFFQETATQDSMSGGTKSPESNTNDKGSHMRQLFACLA